MIQVRRGAFVVVLTLAAGCATVPVAGPAESRTAPPPAAPPSTAPPSPAPPLPATDSGTADHWVIYMAAVRAAQIPVQEHVVTDLVPILKTNPDLRWDAQGRVLMATWTKRKYYEGKVGHPYTLPKGATVWLTAVPYFQRACRQWGLPAGQLPLRIAQALGMPPPGPDGNDAFVQMWVDPTTFFRPCPDPEISDRECRVTLGTGPANAGGGCPWSIEQVSAAFVQVSAKHLTWMCDYWRSSYTGDPATSYPWTALGYTFDWGDLLRPTGQSEYVVPEGATVGVESISSAAEYCGRPSD